MKKILSVFAIVGALALASADVQAASVTTFSQPGGTNTPSCLLCVGDYNQILNALNGQLAQWLTFSNTSAESGEMAFSSSLSFAPVSACAVGTAFKIVECLTIVDEAGRVSYIPVE